MADHHAIHTHTHARTQLSPCDEMILWVVNKHQPNTIAELSRLAYASYQHTWRRVQRLERAGMVVRVCAGWKQPVAVRLTVRTVIRSNYAEILPLIR